MELFKQHLVLCQHMSTKEQKDGKEDREERPQADLMRPHDSPSSLRHSSQDKNQIMSIPYVAY